MNTKERLYAVIGGCVGAAVAMVSCSFFPLGAQSQGDRFGEITCTGLKIVAQDGKTGVALGTGAEGSFVAVHGTDGKSRRRCVLMSTGDRWSSGAETALLMPDCASLNTGRASAGLWQGQRFPGGYGVR